jgi:hypothetical protein
MNNSRHEATGRMKIFILAPHTILWCRTVGGTTVVLLFVVCAFLTRTVLCNISKEIRMM